ncbi:MAG: formylmethanofuran dehydrogenase subunit C [Alphaproteobacteria bacterium]|nr:formylmethanofuran dehydrogenase subunit C [Alphaproteobacteria bacterium]
MSALTLKLRFAPPVRLNLSALVPGRLTGMSLAEICALPVSGGRQPLSVGECFEVSGSPGEVLRLEGGSDRFDYVGADHAGGEIVVEGAVGAYAGRRMKAGKLDIRGDAGDCLASNLRGGLVTVSGSAGCHLGLPKPGEKDGMAGGTVIVQGDTGEFPGERMRRGLLLVKGRLGENSGARMMGGVIWAEQGLSRGAGAQMRRGTLIGPMVETPLATFADCGELDLLIVRIMDRHWREQLGESAPPAITGPTRRLMGDMASLGKGEILLTQS